MADRLRSRAPGPVTARMALRLALVLSGLCLLTVRYTADARADLQSQVEYLQNEVARAHGAVAYSLASCAATTVPMPSDVVAAGAALVRPAQSSMLAVEALQQAPRGIDACARMEDADAKVVSALTG